MSTNKPQLHLIIFCSIFVVAGTLFSFGVIPVVAQTFIEPTTPLGGVTAAPLNSSGTTQRKSGSLIIGPSGAVQSKLCLNASSEGDTPNCISSWSNLTGNYVKLRTTGVSLPLSSNPLDYDAGYARIKGKLGQNYTLIAEAADTSGSAAIYAYDSGIPTSYAGYFAGNVYIGDGSATSEKKLCLNDVDLYINDPNNNGQGCITTWNDVVVSAGLETKYVVLQAAPGPLTVQVGGEALTGAGVFGSDPATNGGVVLGLPVGGANVCWSCGDGICSPGEALAGCVVGFRPPGPPACTNVPIPPIGPGGDC